MVKRIALPSTPGFPGLTLEGSVALVRALQTHHCAEVICHDEEADGAITFDLWLDAQAIKSMRWEYRVALTTQNLAHVAACREWMQQVRTRLARTNELTNPVHAPGSPLRTLPAEEVAR